MKYKNTINFEYWPDDKDGVTKPVRLSFDVSNDFTCDELQEMSKKFAYVLGFMSDSIEECFGPTKDFD